VIELNGACRRHRSALLDFVDRGEIGSATGQALAHLDRCDRCTNELEATLLAITALRRLGADAERVEPAPDAWPRLRARLDRWRPSRWAIMSPTAGAVMSLALVAVLVVPLRLGGAVEETGPSAAPASGVDATTLTDRRVEAEYITSTRRGTLPANESVIRPTGTYPRNYPDGIHPERKEVSPAEPSGRPPEAI